MTHLFRFLALMPLRWMQGLGKVLGWLVWWFSPAYRSQFQRQIQARWIDMAANPCGPVAATGKMVAELPWLWAQSAGPIGVAACAMGWLSPISNRLCKQVKA
jgi:KDO2-lipid IV(A) lauroyltransferase